MSFRLTQSLGLVACLAFASCASRPLSESKGQVTAPSEIPGINSPVWMSLDSWPKEIQKGDIRYELTTKTVGDSEQDNSSLSPRDVPLEGKKYIARYYPKDLEANDDDWGYGPLFGWRSNGQVYLKGMTDENSNEEFNYFYPDGSVCMRMTREVEQDLESISCYTIEGEKVGCLIKQYRQTWYRPMRSLYLWDGNEISEAEFDKHWMRFRNEREQYF